MGISIVIPWLDRGEEDRRQVAEHVIEYYRSLNIGEVVLGTYEDDGAPLNRSRLRNNGVRVSSGDIVFVCDADVLVPEAQVLEACHLAETTDGPVYPVDVWRTLVSYEDTQKILEGEDFTQFLDLSPNSYYINGEVPEDWVCPAFAMKRSSYLSIGGFDEEYVGWGHEDVDFFFRARNLLSEVQTVRGGLAHLDYFKFSTPPYDLAHTQGTEEQQLFQQNIARLNKKKSDINAAKQTFQQALATTSSRPMLLLVGLPHTRFDEDAYSWCAFTTKAIRWTKMMSAMGYDITVAWGGSAPADSYGMSTYIPLVTDEEFSLLCEGKPPQWDASSAVWTLANERTRRFLPDYKSTLVLVVGGCNHDAAINGFTGTILEPFVGYVGVSHQTTAKAFESFAWRHFIYGRNEWDGNPQDAVIYNWHDPQDFEVGEDHGYLLYLGRKTSRKGVQEVAEIAREVGRPLIIAGPEGHLEGDVLVCDDDTRVNMSGIFVQDVGVVGPDDRRTLLSHASAVLVPTRYVGPWEGVAAEAMMSGVHPVTTNWGSFTEYVYPETRFTSLDTALDAVDWAVHHRGETPNGMLLRDVAIRNFGPEVSARRMDAWLHQFLAD